MPTSPRAVPRVSIGPITQADRAPFLAATAASVGLHGRWVAPPRTPEQFNELLGKLSEAQHHGFLVREKATGGLVGMINITNVVMGRLKSGHVGYYGFSSGTGRGLMTEGLRLVVEHAFDVLGLHRLEAGIQPDNDRSIELVRRAGFRYEGLSPRYLWVDEAWCDHERWAITTEDLI